MNLISLQETEQLCHSQAIATIKFKIMEMLQICTINLLSSSQMLILINFTTLKRCLRLLSTMTQAELSEESRIQITLKKSYNYKQLSNTSSKIFNTLELQCNNCQMIPQKPWFLKVAASSKKKSSMKQKISSQRLSTSQDILVTLLITSLYATIR